MTWPDAQLDWRGIDEPAYIEVIDLADGSRRRFEIPTQATATTANWGATGMLWVTRDEVAVTAGYRDLSTGIRTETILRIDLSTLTTEPRP